MPPMNPRAQAGGLTLIEAVEVLKVKTHLLQSQQVGF